MPAKQPERTRHMKKAIVIVDDHPLVRRGLTALINNEPDLTVCVEATICRAALQAIQQSNPDLVIVDLVLEGVMTAWT